MSGTDLRVGSRGTSVPGSAWGAWLLAAGRCKEWLTPRDIRCRRGVSNFWEREAPSTRSLRLCFMLNSLPGSSSESKPYKPPLPPPNLTQNPEPFEMREGSTRSRLLGPPTRFSLPFPAARPEETLFSATANSRMSFAPGSPQGGGGRTCQVGWRRATTAPGEACQRPHLARLPALTPHLARAWR